VLRTCIKIRKNDDGNLEDKRPFGKPKHRWRIIRVYLKDTGLEDAEWAI
jgi:hypothetical protein